MKFGGGIAIFYRLFGHLSVCPTVRLSVTKIIAPVLRER